MLCLLGTIPKSYFVDDADKAAEMTEMCQQQADNAVFMTETCVLLPNILILYFPCLIKHRNNSPKYSLLSNRSYSQSCLMDRSRRREIMCLMITVNLICSIDL
jgi:hypothetical protein